MIRLKAERRTIPAGFRWFAQQMLDADKVEALRVHLRAGGEVPPVVVADYDGALMPIDGHHRTAASGFEHLPLDAWVISGKRFDRADAVNPLRAEDAIDCGGVTAMLVAEEWHRARR